MKLKTAFLLLAALVMASTSSAASAGMYVFGGTGITAHEYSNVNNSSGYKIGVGYMSPTSFGFEASYINFGTATIIPSGTLSMSGTNLSGVFQLPLYPLVMSFKLGVYNIDAQASGSYPSTGISWGMLIGFPISDRATLFMDTEGFGNVDAGATVTESPALITFGARFNL